MPVGILNLGQKVLPPSSTADKLYNISGNIMWNGETLIHTSNLSNINSVGTIIDGIWSSSIELSDNKITNNGGTKGISIENTTGKVLINNTTQGDAYSSVLTLYGETDPDEGVLFGKTHNTTNPKALYTTFSNNIKSVKTQYCYTNDGAQYDFQLITNNTSSNTTNKYFRIRQLTSTNTDSSGENRDYSFYLGSGSNEHTQSVYGYINILPQTQNEHSIWTGTHTDNKNYADYINIDNNHTCYLFMKQGLTDTFSGNEYTNTAGWGLGVGKNNTNNNFVIAKWKSDDNNLHYGSGNNSWQTPALLIDDNNKIGIGNTNPSKTLDVTGDINFTGTLYQNGSAFSGSGGGGGSGDLSSITETSYTFNGTKNSTDFTFDGSNDYFEISANLAPQLNTENFTIEFWFKNADNSNNNKTIISQGTHSDYNLLKIYINSSNNIVLSFNNNQAIMSTASITFNDYNHYTFTYNNLNNFVGGYINGISKTITYNSGSDIGQTTTATGKIEIGRNIINNNEYINGNVKLLKIWNIVKSANDILNSFTTTGSTTSGNLSITTSGSTNPVFNGLITNDYFNFNKINSLQLLNSYEVHLNNNGSFIKWDNATDDTWQGHIYSMNSFTGSCYLKIKNLYANTVYYKIGITTSDPLLNKTFTDLDYAWHPHPNGSCYAYEDGTNIGVISNSYNENDIFEIIYQGTTVEYYHNNVLKRTQTETSGLTFYLDAAIYTSGKEENPFQILEFSESKQNLYLEIPSSNSYDLNNKDFTLEFWAFLEKPEETYSVIFSQGLWNTTNISNSTNLLTLYIIKSNDRLYLDYYNEIGTQRFIKINPTSYYDSWHHYAITFNNSNKDIIFYIDGNIITPESTGGTSSNNISSTGKINLGVAEYTDTSKSQFFIGKIKKFRLYSDIRTQDEIKLSINTHSLVTHKYPPIYVIPAYMESKLVLHIKSNTTNGSTTIVDSTNRHTIQVSGNTNHSTTKTLSGSTSIYFDGNGDYLTIPTNDANFSDFDFNQEDFTIEMWLYPTNDSGAPIGRANSSGLQQTQILITRYNKSYIILIGKENGSDGWSVNTGWQGSVDSNKWHHLAISRYKNKIRLFVDGINIIEATLPSGLTHTLYHSTTYQPFRIGTYNQTSGVPHTAQGTAFSGYMDEIKIIKGEALYISDFTVGNYNGTINTDNFEFNGTDNYLTLDYKLYNPNESYRFYNDYWQKSTGSDQRASVLDEENISGHNIPSWAGKNNNVNDTNYMTIELENITRITGIVTQGRTGTSQRVTSYKILYSIDNINYIYVDNEYNFSGNPTTESVDTKKYNYFQTPVDAKYIRFDPTGMYEHICMRAALLTDTITPNLSNKSFTIEFWAYLTGGGSAYFQSQNDPDNFYATGTSIDINSTSSILRLDFNAGTLDVSTDMTQYYNKWNHFVFIFNNNNSGVNDCGYIYINGIKQTTTNYNSSNFCNGTTAWGKAYIGRRSSSSPNYFNGKIKHLRIYEDMKTHNDIQKSINYNSINPANSSNLVLDIKSNRNTDNGLINFDFTSSVNNNGSLYVSPKYYGGISLTPTVDGLNFIAGGDYVDLGNITLSGPLSISCWIRIHNAGGAGYGRVLTLHSSDSSIGLQLNCSPGNLLKWGFMGYQSNGYTWSSNVWIHCVCIIESDNTANFYVNNSLVSSHPPDASYDINRNIDYDTFYIGAYIPGYETTRNFDGNIHSFALHNRVLSSSEITQLYNNGTKIPQLIGFVYNTFTDASGSTHTINYGGNIHHSTSKVISGISSIYFNNSSNSSGTDYLSISDSEDWNFSGTDFTIEMYIYCTNFSGYPTIISQTGSWDATASWWLGLSTSGQVLFTFAADAVGTWDYGETSTGTISLNTWHHIAVTRHGTTLYQFRDGVVIGTHTTSQTINSSTNNLFIGKHGPSNNNYFVGYMDNIRIIKGEALYTANFDYVAPVLSDYSNVLHKNLQLYYPMGNNDNNIYTVNNLSNPNLDNYSTTLSDNLQIYIPMNSNDLNYYRTDIDTTSYIPDDTINNNIKTSFPDNLLTYVPMNSSDLKIYTSYIWRYNGHMAYYNSGNVGINTDNPSTELHINGTTTITGDIIPSINNQFDIGSAEYKIRDLYVSDTSLWIGDKHKVAIENGELKFRKRKTNVVPSSILSAGGNQTAALNFAGVSNISDMKLEHWRNYMRTLPNKKNANVSDIFRNVSDDYEEETNALATAPLNSPALTGSPTAPTVNSSDNSTKIATTSFVHTVTNTKASISSPSFSGTPTAPTAPIGNSTIQIATTQFVQTAVSNLVDSAPGTLNTLNELAAALGDDPNYATTISGLLADKAAKLNPTFTGTEAITLPMGTENDRPSTGVKGTLRYNSDNDSFEGFSGSGDGNWGAIGGNSSQTTETITTNNFSYKIVNTIFRCNLSSGVGNVNPLVSNTDSSIGMFASITPTSTSSVIRIEFNIFGEYSGTNADYNNMVFIKREIDGGSTDYIRKTPAGANRNYGITTLASSYKLNSASTAESGCVIWYDEPNTTSEVTYTLCASVKDAMTFRVNSVHQEGNSFHTEDGMSVIALSETNATYKILDTNFNITLTEPSLHARAINPMISNTDASVGFFASITPTSTNSVIRLEFNVFGEFYPVAAGYNNILFIKREVSGETDYYIRAPEPTGNISNFNYGITNLRGTHPTDADNTPEVGNIIWYDTPNTTSQVTYTLCASVYNTGTFYVNRVKGTTNDENYEEGMSVIALSETNAVYKPIDTIFDVDINQGVIGDAARLGYVNPMISNSDASVGLFASITPTSISSVIRIEFNVFGEFSTGEGCYNHVVFIKRVIDGGSPYYIRATQPTDQRHYGITQLIAHYPDNATTTPESGCVVWYDTPNTTSEVTYTLCVSARAAQVFRVNNCYSYSSNSSDRERGMSMIALSEPNISTSSGAGTGGYQLPVGTTAQQPNNSSRGMIRYNTTDNIFEGYDGSNWDSLGGGSSGYSGVNYNYVQSHALEIINIPSGALVPINTLTVQITPISPQSNIKLTTHLFGEFSNFQLTYSHMILFTRQIGSGSVELLRNNNIDSLSRNVGSGVGALTNTQVDYAAANHTPETGLIMYIDSPNTSETITYVVAFQTSRNTSSTQHFHLNRISDHDSNVNNQEYEIGISSLLVEDLGTTNIGSGSSSGSSGSSIQPGDTIETLVSQCDGSSVTVKSGLYTFENVTTRYSTPSSFATSIGANNHISGSLINYTPPAGTTRVVYKFNFIMAKKDNHPLVQFALYIDNQQIANSRMSYGENGGYGNVGFMEFVINCNAASLDLNKGHYTDWTTSKRLEVRCQNKNPSYHEAYIHWNYWWNQSDNSDTSLIYVPKLEIKAIA